MSAATPDLSMLQATYEHLSSASPATAIVDVLGLINDLKREIKVFEELVWSDMQARVSAMPGKRYELGETVYYVGKKKKVKCKDAVKLMDHILTQYSLDDLGNCLSANAFKDGTVKKLLDKDFPSLYNITEEDELELSEVKTRFLK